MPPPNLLDIVPATLAVSSTVDNPRDFPEHLIDGNPSTAWNGRTGDLVGGYIAFRVPDDATVESIEMTAGFDKVSGAVDLFTANHRITKVEVLRVPTDATFSSKEASLDPNVRGLQSIPIHGKGGSYYVKVRATLPGTKAAWKELVVSEFRVTGAPGKERRAPTDPLVVGVGTLDPTTTTGDAGTGRHLESNNDRYAIAFPDLAALCDDNTTRARKENAANAAFLSEMSVRVGTPTCREEPQTLSFTPDATYTGLRTVRWSNGWRTESTFILVTPRGLVITPIAWAVDNPTDPGCPSIVRPAEIEEVRIENGFFVATVVGERLGYSPNPVGQNDDGTRLEHVRGAAWCKEAAGRLICKSHNPQYLPALGSKLQPVTGWKEHVPWSTLPWRELREFHIGPEGALHVKWGSRGG